MTIDQIDDIEKLRPPNKRWVPRLLLGSVVVGLILLQLLPLTQDFSNPPVLSEPTWNSQRTLALAQRACWDCHSNETRWPWYTRVAPFSMVIRKDVEMGREVMNFSEWKEGGKAKIEDITETITKAEMPLSYYVILHPEADLTNGERGELINGLIATLLDGRLESEEMAPESTEELEAESE